MNLGGLCVITMSAPLGIAFSLVSPTLAYLVLVDCMYLLSETPMRPLSIYVGCPIFCQNNYGAGVLVLSWNMG
jgi:hypothetical protein